MANTQNLLNELKQQRGKILKPREEHKDTEKEQQQMPRGKNHRTPDQKANFSFEPIPVKQ